MKQLVIMLSLLLGVAIADTYDDDTILEFYWEPATGNVDHYDVYLSVNDGVYCWVDSVDMCPTVDKPYILPMIAQHGYKYIIAVQAMDAEGNTGPTSEPSDPVWCRLDPPQPAIAK